LENEVDYIRKTLAVMTLGLGFSGILAGFQTKAAETPKDIIEIQPKDFVSTYLLDEKTREAIRKGNNLHGFGEADYAFEANEDAWQEFWVQGGGVFEVILDGRTILRSTTASGVWKPVDNLEKMLNVHVTAGRHLLRISKPEPMGIPWIGKMQFRKAKDLTGMVRIEPVGDCLALRKGEPLRLRVKAGKGAAVQHINVAVCAESCKAPVFTKKIDVPAGKGDFGTEMILPSSIEGVFDAAFSDEQGHAVDRTIQYLVADVKDCPKMDREPKRELVQEIDCAKQAPEYSSGETRVVHSSLGAYRESGDKGRMEFNSNADWFAYTLKLPSIQEPYLAEIEYPDDDERVTIVSMIDRVPNPYAPTLGYASGGIYSLSNSMLTEQFYFYPREKDPRLLAQTWRMGMRSAVARIRVFKLSSMPPALKFEAKGRAFGGYQEENIRFTSYYGSTPDGTGWSNFYKAAYRFGVHSKFLGANLWQQTIGNYQATLWPCRTIKGYGPDTEGGACIGGPLSQKDPVTKDAVRLQLLVCEKFGMDYIGELHLPANRAFMLHMDKVLGGAGTVDDNGPRKPWLAVSKSGECGPQSLIKPYWNPFYPGVQDWTASVISEIANRYKDSPAFKGISLRLLAWCFSGWQTVPSIDWGYEDYTVDLFQKERGVAIPAPADGPKRFANRYEWLMANAYDKWVDWRCAKMYAYHARLAKILTDARPDLKLYLTAYSPIYDRDYEQVHDWKAKGWTGLIKEAGIDTAFYNKNPSMVLQGVTDYPSSCSRSETPLKAAVSRDQTFDTEQTRATAHGFQGGTICATHFDADSFEGEMVEGKTIGYERDFKDYGKTTIHGAGVINPAGIHFLERFAEAMAAGNMTVISDGSHGYDQQQPQYVRPFLAEYRSLPLLGMTPVEIDADPVAAWQGAGDDGKMYFYVVNRLDKPVDATVRFEGSPSPVRLSTKECAKTEKGILKLTLSPYEMRSFEGGPVGTKILDVNATPPKDTCATLRMQIAFADSLASAENAELTVIQLSPVELRKARQCISAAKTALGKGRVWTARHTLLSTDMTRLYEALHAYPPQLFFKKAPPAPKGAMLPTMLRDAALPTSIAAQVSDASRLAPSLTGIKAFRWNDASVRIKAMVQCNNHYRLELAYVNGHGCCMPRMRIDGKEMRSNRLTVEEGPSWGRVVGAELLALSAGAHTIELSKAAASDAAVLYLRLEPVPRDLVSSDWMVIGPFQGSEDPRVSGSLAKMMNTKWPPEKSLNFSVPCEGSDGKTVSWRKPPSNADYIDLYEWTGAFANRIGYAVCRLESPAQRDAQIKFGVDFWARIWLNGEIVFSNVGNHASKPHKDEYTIPVRLASGRNEIMIKVHAGSMGNGFWMSISDPGDLKMAIP
jgi:hypothetical protein